MISKEHVRKFWRNFMKAFRVYVVKNFAKIFQKLCKDFGFIFENFCKTDGNIYVILEEILTEGI